LDFLPRRFVRASIYLLAIFCLIATSGVRAAESIPAKRVLMISTGSRFAPGFAVAEQSALDTLRNLGGGQIDVYSESLDIVRFPSESYRRLFRVYLYEKYAESPPDLLLLIYVGNLGVAGKLLEQLFPEVPIVVAGFTEEGFSTGQFGSYVSGIAQRVDARGTIELIRRLQPETRRVVVIGGTAEVDRQVISRAKEAARSFSSLVEFDFWTGRSMTDIRDAVRSLPPQTAILFTRMFRDAAGRAFNSAQAAQSIAEFANVPLYVMADTTFGTGALGGSVVDVASMGKRAGELAHRVLSGAAPASFEIRVHGVPMFDWRALKRWGISESRLPPDSVVRFREPSVWQQYKWLIILVLSFCLLEAGLIDILLRERRRRRLAQETLEERLRFERLVSEVSGTFINLSAQKVDSHIHEVLRKTIVCLKFDIATLALFTERGTEARLVHVCTAQGVPEIPSDLTDKDFPWSVQELSAGRDVCLRSLEMLPLAARTDRATYEKYHVRSSFSVPMIAGGKVIGILGLHAVSKPREVPPELLQGQRLLGEIFANALARNAAEESLRQSEENLRNLVETTAAVPWRADTESWDFTYVGPQAVDLLGYPIEQWYEKDFWVDHLHPDDKDFAVKTCLALSKTAEQFEFEYRMLAAAGKIVWVHDIVNCEHREGTPTQLRGFFLDISERKQSEKALSESEERFRMMADTAPVMIWMSGPDKLCNFFNKGWLDFTGRTLEQELGHGWAEGVYREDLQRCLEIYNNSFDTRQEFTMEYRLRRHDGEYCWILDHGVARFEHDGIFLGYIGTAIDITARRQGEEMLKQERAFLKQVIDINPNFMFAKDREGRFTLANQAVADAYGTTVEELIGRNDGDFNKNGRELEFFRRMDLEVLDTQQERFIPEERITDAQGKTRWLQTVKRPISDKDGCAYQVLGASTDITQRKETESELRQQRDELAHVTRISAMGELAASLAHELNQPLTAILSNAQAAQRFLSAIPADINEVREILKDIVHDNSRAGEVIRRIRALIKKEHVDFAPLDLVNVIGDVRLLLHSDAIVHKVRVSLEVNPGLPLVRGDKIQLQQVVLNLLLNAFDSMKDCPAHERRVIVQVEADGARAVRLTVRDRGIGLSAEKLGKIFQPFYTTKRDGLGMGLSICRSIIEAHDGRLGAENNLHRGAAFHFTLPVESAAA
jgi:two-component system sensor kinase FixL